MAMPTPSMGGSCVEIARRWTPSAPSVAPRQSARLRISGRRVRVPTEGSEMRWRLIGRTRVSVRVRSPREESFGLPGIDTPEKCPALMLRNATKVQWHLREMPLHLLDYSTNVQLPPRTLSTQHRRARGGGRRALVQRSPPFPPTNTPHGATPLVACAMTANQDFKKINIFKIYIKLVGLFDLNHCS